MQHAFCFSSPAGGGTFLLRQESTQRMRHRGDAEILLPQEHAPSPMYPTRSALSIERKVFCTWVIISVTFEKVYNTPCAQTCAQGDHKDLQSINRACKNAIMFLL